MTVEAFEAKTRFSELLKRVSEGAEITITRYAKPVARLVPFKKPSRVELAALFQQMSDFRTAHPLNPKGLGKVSYRQLIDRGRNQ
ncbi:MAG: type toxin-antitoxin system Phd/YefM family antitoxin [Pedosphaera sp.]|nr:type toxin-antitoxin system Phd/YefM family antitoxin [Pedosphaera sp.]